MADTRICPDCAVAPGTPHEVNCDVARCVCCGFQAFCHGDPADDDAYSEDPDSYEGPWLCEHTGEPIPEVWQVWTGEWPGVVECQELGWYSVLTRDSGWVSVGPEHPEATEDLNRLVRALAKGQLVWDRELQRAVVPS